MEALLKKIDAAVRESIEKAVAKLQQSPIKEKKDAYLTITDTAKYLNVSKSTIYKALTAGDLIGYRIRGKSLLKLCEIEASLIVQNQRGGRYGF